MYPAKCLPGMGRLFCFDFFHPEYMHRRWSNSFGSTIPTWAEKSWLGLCLCRALGRVVPRCLQPGVPDDRYWCTWLFLLLLTNQQSRACLTHRILWTMCFLCILCQRRLMIKMLPVSSRERVISFCDFWCFQDVYIVSPSGMIDTM